MKSEFGDESRQTEDETLYQHRFKSMICQVRIGKRTRHSKVEANEVIQIYLNYLLYERGLN